MSSDLNCTWSNQTVGVQRFISDYLKLGFYGLLLIIGAPCNLQAFVIHFTRLRVSQNKSQALRFVLLRFNLILANLVILLIHVPSQIGWFAAYEWLGGEALCRLMKFFDVFGFYLSSNAIMIMALDSMITVVKKCEAASIGFKRVRNMLSISYILAFIFSFPQLIVWTTVFFSSVGITQCTTVWALHRWHNCINAFLGVEIAYRSLHLALVFWVPASITFCCYVVLLSEVVHHRHSSFKTSQNVRTPSSDPASVPTFLDRIKKKSNRRPQSATHSSPSETKLSPVSPMHERASTHIQSPDSKNHNGATSLLLVPSPDDAGHGGGHATFRAQVNNPSFRRRQARFATTLRQPLYIVTAYMLCYLPYNVIALIEIVKKQTWLEGLQLVEFLEGLVVLNSVVNPFLYKLNSPR